jgi:hypothetical protein
VLVREIFLQQHQQQWRSLREINYQMNNILITSAGKRVSLMHLKKIESYFPDKKFFNRLQSTTFCCLHDCRWMV